MKEWALLVHREDEAWRVDVEGEWGRCVKMTLLRGVGDGDGSSDRKCVRKLDFPASVV